LTPHPLHEKMAVSCLEAGCHVLVEKPVAVTVGEADRMNATAKATGRLLGVSYQMRFKPEIIAAKQLISEGKLGKLQRVTLIMPWARSRKYFTVGGWRATWNGEGGGVLINQAIHDLDLLVHLAGMPRRIVAWTRTRFHNIETEDSACAMLEWDNGALGQVSVSTAEAGPRQAIELVGTRGMLSIGTGDLTWRPFEQDVFDFLGQTEELFTGPNWGEQDIELRAGGGDHRAVYQNFHAAIQDQVPLMVDGIEGIKSLELANAMIYSSHQHCEVELPLDREAYEQLLAKLRKS
jgi:predicted dehydrogenase